MDNRNSRKSYSDLEAIVTTSAAPGRQSYWNAKFAIPSTPEPIHKTADGADAPEAVPSQFISSSDDKSALDAKSFFDSSPVDTVAPAPPAYFLVDSKGQAQALYTVPSNTASDTSSIVNFKGGISPAPPSAGGWWKSLGEGKRICGLRKNVFLAVLAGVCMLVLGLLLTVLLLTHPPGKHGSKGSNKDDDDAPKFSTLDMLKKGDMGPFLAASSLAAMNWTVAGQPFIGVFYQSSAATGSGLMVAIKNETSQQWSSVNISASASSPSVLPGTPLAAASNNGLWNLYYLTESMTVAEIYSTDPTSASGWLQGDFAAKMGSPAVFPGSGLGAMWQLCDDCNDALFVSWQNAQDGSLAFANMTNMTWGGAVVLDSNAADGSPVTINAFTDTGKSVAGDHNAVRFYFTEDDSLVEMMKGPLGSGQLIAGNDGKCQCSPSKTMAWEHMY